MLMKIFIILFVPFAVYVNFLAICSLFVHPHKEYEKHSDFYRFLLNSGAWIAIKLQRIRVHISGIDRIPTDVKPLFVGNHRSNNDPIITWYVLKKWKVSFLSKATNFDIPFFGKFIRKCCFLEIDREHPEKAIVTIHKAADILKRQEVSIGVYPEGTRSKSCELLPFHNGVFKIAKKANVPIVVIAIRGTERVRRNYPLKSSDVYVDIIDVIPASQVEKMTTKSIGIQVKSSLERSLDEKQETGRQTKKHEFQQQFR